MHAKVATSKLVFFLAFICCALLALVFLSHLRTKPMETTLANGNALVFPAAREIKPFTLVQSNQQEFKQSHFYHHWTLLFFGFTHCASVCPVTLDMLNRTYATLHAKYPNLQVVLISLDPERDSLSALTQYTQSFNPAFIGVTGRIQEIRKLQSQLGIFSTPDNTNSSDNNYQLQHTSSILLVNPDGKWAGLFKFGMTPEQFIVAFQESMRVLS